VTYPSIHISGLPITGIGNDSFYYSQPNAGKMTSLTISDSVTSIGYLAIYNCAGLTNVTIGNSVTSIGDAAFGYASLSSVIIPKSVTSIGDGAFAGNPLASVCFEGNEPSVPDFQDGIFFANNTHFSLKTIYYVKGAQGWGTNFEGFPTAPCIQCAGTGTINGHVYCTCDGSAIAGASVVVGINSVGIFSTTSASDGSYSISGIPVGTYSATVSKTNYYTITNSVTIPSGSLTNTQNFSLSPLPGLDYFGVGVNWANVTTPSGLSGVRGDIDASNLYNHLKTDLSSTFKHGTIVPLDATLTSANNLNIITSQFNQFATSVATNDTVVFYGSSHAVIGNFSDGTSGFVLWLSSDGPSHPGLTYSEFASLLNGLPNSVRKIVILDACHAGGIGDYLANSVKNISILASGFANPVTVGGINYTGNAFSEADGTGVFTDTLIAVLDAGIFDLNRITYDILIDSPNTYAGLYGQNLSLRDSGTAVFAGLQPQLYEGSGFTGNLASNTVSVVQSPPKVSKARIVSNSFQMTLTNVPSSGSIAIEVSTNLNSWLQVAFSPAAGTNLSFSFPTTNYTAAFFRTKVVP
jgi:hypothetical protein